MKIKQLTSEKILRLKAVEITTDPNGNLIIIGGKNGQGKTSVLESIEMALGGQRRIPEEPVHEGEENGRIILDLGEIVVERRIARNGNTQLQVRNKEGAVYQSPQRILDALVGGISFDPLAFARMQSKEQLDLLKKIMGLDFSIADKQREDAYRRRTEVNRALANGLLAKENMRCIESVSADESIEEIQSKISEIKPVLDRSQKIKEDIRVMSHAIETTAASIRVNEKRIIELQATVAKLKIEHDEKCSILEKLEAEKQTLIVPELSEFYDEMEQRRLRNHTRASQRRAKAEYDELFRRNEELASESEKLSDLINAIDREKKDKIKAAPLPIPGLGFNEIGVTFDGKPFRQSSSAEQLRISVAIGLALHPKLNVMLIRDGSLLDDESLKLLGQIAEEHDAQLWIERVSQGNEVSVIIEDGSVKENRIFKNKNKTEPKCLHEGDSSGNVSNT